MINDRTPTSYKVRSPFASPFAKAILAIFWIVYVGLIISLIASFDSAAAVIAIAWTFILPWLTWCFLSGVRVDTGRSVGGGPMYLRVALEPGEDLRFNAAVSTGHVFITSRRLIFLPIRFYGRVEAIDLADISAVATHRRGSGWLDGGDRITLKVGPRQLTFRPFNTSEFMGGMPGKRFVQEALDELAAGGVSFIEANV